MPDATPSATPGPTPAGGPESAGDAKVVPIRPKARCYVCGKLVDTYTEKIEHPQLELEATRYNPHGTDIDHCKGSAQPISPEGFLLDPKDWRGTAKTFVDGQDLLYQAGVFYRWDQAANAWLEVEDDVIRAEVWDFLEKARKPGKPNPEKRVEHQPFNPKRSDVGEALEAVQSLITLPKARAAPRWLTDTSPTDLIAFPNGLLRLSDRRLLDPTPAWYNHVALPFRYDPEARAPGWLDFLKTLWPDDPQSIECLQEVFGCFVSGETRFQKIFMLVGPKRSGKGTTARILRELLGHINVCGPTLAGLAQHFGYAPLIHKTAAIVSDARITGRSDPAMIVERLLKTSGEDADSVPRKFKPDWEGQLSVRFLLLTNELPRIEDASGALASRFVILQLQNSFYGREDLDLFDRLKVECPGILNWALEGWTRLQGRGSFVAPESARELQEQFELLGSPVAAFLKECCVIGPACAVPKDRLFVNWKRWCEDNGRLAVGTTATFGRDLKAALPGVGSRRLGPAGKQVAHYSGLGLVEPEGADY